MYYNKIISKDDLKYFLYEDKKALRLQDRRIIVNVCWKFIKSLRNYEYQLNRRNFPGKKLFCLFARLRWYKWSVKTGISISPNCFSEGLALWHYGDIQVNSSCKCGKKVTIQSGVCVMKSVVLGSDVYIAPGAKILEGVTVADGVTIGANAVVTHDIDKPNTVWVGVPAKKIR